MECVGECSRAGGCKGDIKKVSVIGNGFKKPFNFYYCDAAIAEDIRRGFVVEIIEDFKGAQSLISSISPK